MTTTLLVTAVAPRTG